MHITCIHITCMRIKRFTWRKYNLHKLKVVG